MMMTILGYVKPNAKMFTVNFLRGNDIAFHINPRFNEGGKQVVVRNHKLGERWGQEERDLKGPFPFASGSTLSQQTPDGDVLSVQMKVLCTPEAFRVAVNNIPMFEFRHRIRELNQIDRINILHDVVLTYINVETASLRKNAGDGAGIRRDDAGERFLCNIFLQMFQLNRH
ncbi:Galectin-3 [Oryzias melastigma]|uniref:Galectin n=1 Tax=Oryzias melastigma TaxID=30732 RepID=A0A834CA17_ORYME|nr:Galectin-3 [Oryzias melastigma]